MSQTKLVPHIDYAIPSKAHTPMYLMHKWWARKPHNVVAEYISRYSKEGEIVLDPFCGSGVTAVEALRLGRKAVAIDLDPMATLITRMTAVRADIAAIKQTYHDMKNEIADDIRELYTTRCPKCKAAAPTICAIWKEGGKQPVEIRLYCPNCKKRCIKKPSPSDLQKLEQIGKQKIPYWYPNPRLYYNAKPFIKKERSESLADLFTKRNLLALSLLYHEICQIKDDLMRDLFKFRFTSMVHLASKLTPVRPTRPFSSFWALQSYWVPPINMESNVWWLFMSAIVGRQGLVAGKEDTNASIPKYVEARSFDDLTKNANILVSTQSALDLSNMPPNSIDYVFTDPPYGGSVQYFELSYLWASWLEGEEKDPRFRLDFGGEITINDQQNKDFDYYHKMLRVSFEQVYRVLKLGRWLTVTFHNTDIKIYNSILKAVVLSGFDLEKVVYQPPARASAKSLLQPYGSAVGDYYIRFRKPEKQRGALVEPEIDRERYERIVVDTVTRIVAQRGEPTPYSVIINSYPLIYDELKKNGYLFSTPENVEDILKRNVDTQFVLIPVTDAKGAVLGKKWWFKDESKIPFIERVPLAERVERAVINVLNRKVVAVSFDDILQEIFITFPNSLTPDTESIRGILAQYGEKTPDGKWRLKPAVRSREGQHDKIVEMLAEIGQKAGFEVYADIPAYRKPLSFDVPPQNLERIREIDVLWHDGSKVEYEFEVENSTGITEAIVRGANIPGKMVKRYIVIPEEREKLLARKVEEPALKERIKADNWGFIRYDQFSEFYSKNKSKKKIQPDDIETMARPPKARSLRDPKMEEFSGDASSG